MRPTAAELAEAERLLDLRLARVDRNAERDEEQAFRLAEDERHEIAVARATLDGRLASEGVTR